MADLKHSQKKMLEKALGMEEGFVLDFTNREFEDFFRDEVGIEIYSSKYEQGSGSKANRLRAFWRNEDNQLVSKALHSLIDYIKGQVSIGELDKLDYPAKLLSKVEEIANELAQDSVHDASVLEFGEADYEKAKEQADNLAINQSEIIKQRIDEIEKCIANEAPLAAIFLAGSTLEGLLMQVASSQPQRFATANAAPIYKGKVRNIDNWNLGSLIDVSHELGILSLNAKKFGHELRDLRNFIHPYEQAKNNFSPNIRSAKICLHVLFSSIEDLEKSTDFENKAGS